MPNDRLGRPVRALHPRRTAPIADKGTIISIVSWLLLAIVVCILIARFAVKLSLKTKRRKFGLDDLFIALSALFSVGQTIAVSIEAMEVLGQHTLGLDSHQTIIYQKTEYVACILHIANNGCARMSVCFLIMKILPGTLATYTTLIFAGFIFIWTIVGVIVTAFACKLPNPWNFLRAEDCIDPRAFVNYISISNIVLESLLVLIPLAIWNVRMSKSQTATVSLVFMARLSIVGALGTHLYFFNQAAFRDFTYGFWAAALCQQIAQNLAVICACLPVLHPLIIRLLVGNLKPDIVHFDSKSPRRDTSSSESEPLQSSRASLAPLTRLTPEPYCRPLVTWGLDHSSLHRHSRSATHFPTKAAKPVFTPRPPESFFNRLIEVPQSRPPTSSNADPLSAAPQLPLVGILPHVDWDSESSISGGSRRGSPVVRQPDSEYILDRQKVISVAESSYAYNEGSKMFVPPLSPRMPQPPPRAF